MRRGQRHNAITNSPIVRSFIRPVLSTTTAPPATAASSAAQQETFNKYLGEVAQPDEQWLIPTQPSLVAAGGAVLVEEDAGQPGSSDVKGKKRARDEELDGEAQAVEYDAAAGTRFGVQVRYSEDNLPAELEKCASSPLSPRPCSIRRADSNDARAQTGRNGTASSRCSTTGARWTARGGTRSRPRTSQPRSLSAVRPLSVPGGRASEEQPLTRAARAQVGAAPSSTRSAASAATRSSLPSPVSEVRLLLPPRSLSRSSHRSRADPEPLPAVIALDTSPVRLACAAHNARVYGVADRITFILGDWVAWAQAYAERLERGEEMSAEERVECVFLSPPWGGIDYQTTLSTTEGPAQPPAKKRQRQSGLQDGEDDAAPARGGAYPLSALAPLPGADLFALARRMTPNVAMFLPRNVDLLELATLPGLGETEKVEVEEAWMSWKCKAVTAYFGDLAVGNGYVEGVEDEEER